MKLLHRILFVTVLSPLVALNLSTGGGRSSLTTQVVAPVIIKSIAPEPHTTLTAAKTLNAVYVPTPTPAPVISSACGDNTYANYIYMHESGCSTTVTNALGCLGIGQSCPGYLLSNACPNLDYACENQYFTNYAQVAYGGWYNAYLFWQQNKWW